MQKMVRAFNARVNASFYTFLHNFAIFLKSILNLVPIGASKQWIGPLNRASKKIWVHNISDFYFEFY